MPLPLSLLGGAHRRLWRKLGQRVRTVSSRRLIPWTEQVEDRVLLSEVRVNTFTPNDQFFHSVATDAKGASVVTWTGFGQDDGFDVYAQRYNAAGVAEGEEFRINDYTAKAQRAPVAGMDAAGNFVIVWNSFKQIDENSGWDVFAKRYNAAGVALGGEIQVNTSAAGHQEFSTVAVDADGDFVVVWTSDGQDGSGIGVYGRQYDANGVSRSGEFRINQFTTGDQTRPSIAMDADGDYVVAWDSNGQDGSGDGVYARRYGLETGPKGPAFRVNSATAGAQNYNSVAMTPGGDFVVAWESDGQDGSGYGVYAQRYSAAGAAQGSEFRVNSFLNANQAVPRVAMASNGDFAIVWQSFGQDGSGYGMYGQRYTPAGEAQGGEFRVSTHAPGDQWYGGIAMDADGDLVVGWTSVGQDGAGTGVYADRFATTSARTAGPLVAKVEAGSALELVLPDRELTRSDLTRLTVTFSEDLGASVIDSANWSLSRDGQMVVGAVTNITFGLNIQANAYEAVLILASPLTSGAYSLQASPAILDLDGNALDGDFNGVAGGAFAFSFSVNPITVGPEFRVSADPSAQETEPGVRPEGNAIARDARGNFVVVWAADGSDGSGYGVRARRYSADGTPLGAEFTVNTYTQDDQGKGTIEVGISGPPKVAMNASGDFVVTYTSLGQDGSSYGIYAQRFGPTGDRVGNEFRVNGTTAGNQVAPAVDINDSGQFVITWQSPDGNGGYDIYAQRYSTSGARLGGEFRVNATTANWQNVPSVAIRPDGGFVIVWNSYLQDGSSNGIYLRRYDSVGLPLSGDVRVNTFTAGDQSSFHRQSIDMDASGNFVVVWNSESQDGSDYGVYAQLYNASGLRQGGEFRVNTQTLNRQSGASAAMATDGSFLITWESDLQDGWGVGVYAQRYNAAGMREGGEFRVNAITVRAQTTPTAVIDADGNFVVTWISGHEGRAANFRRVYAQRFSIPGSTPEVLVSALPGLTTTEAGGTATFTLRLNTPPVANVTIGLSSSDPTEGVPGVTSLTFTPENWNLPQSVPIKGVDDSIEDGAKAYQIVTGPAVSLDPSYSGLDAPDVSVTNADDDAAGITVSPTGGLVTSEVGASTTFSIRLNSQPTANVTVGLSSSNANEGSLSVNSVTFTPSNWQTAQVVTVTGVDDAVNDGTVDYILITAPAVSADLTYSGRDALDVSASNIDDDTAGISVTSNSDLITTEAGGTALFSVRLNTQPVATVTIPVASSNPSEGQVSVSSLTFDATNWNVSQTVTVTGLDDFSDDEDSNYSVLLGPATSPDLAYNGINPPDVPIVNQDDDTASILITPANTIATTEAGGTAQFFVRLGSKPSANVTIPLSSSRPDEGTIDRNGLTFTPANWDTPQTVTLTGVDDDVEDGAAPYTIVTAPAVTADAKYQALNTPDVEAVNLDDDSAGVVVTATSGLATTEAGGTATFSVRLNSRPTASVALSLSSSNIAEGRLSVANLTFTTANWSTPRLVTVTGFDDVIDDGDILYTVLISPATSDDLNYNDLDAQDVEVRNLDNDTPGVTITPTTGLATTESGGAATFSVRLDSQPSSDVTIGLASLLPTEAVAGTGSLLFTPLNWNIPQVVTVTGVDDPVSDGNRTFAIVTAPALSDDPGYANLDPTDMTGLNLDNDAPGIAVIPLDGLRTSEAGGTATFSVRLNSQPTADVILGLSSTRLDEGRPSATSLTFTPANWNIPQVVTVTGVDDPADDGDIAYAIVTAPASSQDPGYNGLNPADVSATNSDDDSPEPVPISPVSIPPAPVTISRVQVVKTKIRRKTLITVAITFDGDLDAATASSVTNYAISAAAGRDRRFGTADDVLVRLASASYDRDQRTVRLTPRKSTFPLRPRPQLRVRSGGVLDARSRPIDGNRDGRPGGDWISIL